MNKLHPAKRAEILGMMVEGISIRAIVRLTGASKNTVAKLLEMLGRHSQPIRIGRCAGCRAGAYRWSRSGRSFTARLGT
jgi:hypothetical protein